MDIKITQEHAAKAIASETEASSEPAAVEEPARKKPRKDKSEPAAVEKPAQRRLRKDKSKVRRYPRSLFDSPVAVDAEPSFPEKSCISLARIHDAFATGRVSSTVTSYTVASAKLLQQLVDSKLRCLMTASNVLSANLWKRTVMKTQYQCASSILGEVQKWRQGAPQE
eukprot:1154907-Rhodomonas_salina.1